MNTTQDHTPTADDTSGRPAAELVAGSAPVGGAELRTLLQRRLRFLCPLLVVLLGVVGVLILASPVPNLRSATGWSVFPCLLVGAVLAGLVWLRPRLSLRQLRAIELVLVAILAARIVSRTDAAFWSPGSQRAFQTWRETGEERVLNERLQYSAFTMSLTAAIYIVAYGVCIPNTLWRCVIVVGILWGIVPVMWVVGCATEGLPLRVWFNTRVAFVLLDLTFAAALAVYAAYRVETSRQEAAEARRLGQYVLREKLGGGGMGEVFLADHVLLRRPCAIKLIRPERAGDPAMLARFEREVRATAALTHPNAVQVFDYGHTPDGTFYYVMEHLPGPTLDDLVKRDGPLPPDRAVRLLRQLCGALAEAHAIGLIHRDIKPSNVIVCERGRVPDVAKLLDFGLVQSTIPDADDKLTHVGAVLGTPAYLSPEQASGEAVDARSDVYSLGALAYFLLTGQSPFAGKSAMKMIAAHLYETPELPGRLRADIPADLEAVVLRCLAKKPGDRFPDVVSLDRALAACAARSPLEVSDVRPR